MKIPKKTKRFCPYCKKRTDQKIDLVSTGFKRGTMARGSLSRMKKQLPWQATEREIYLTFVSTSLKPDTTLES